MQEVQHQSIPIHPWGSCGSTSASSFSCSIGPSPIATFPASLPYSRILMSNYDKSAPIGILDYDTQEPMCFFAAGMPKDVSPLSMRNDGRIEEHGTAKFIPRKKWIVVGCYSGRIKVYSYMIVRNLKESRSFLASEIKSFKAHNSGRMLLDVHPTEPYLLSASSGDRSLWSAAGMIKLWNWDKGWDCIRTFENQYGGAYHVKFNPMDANSFLAISDDGGDVQVYNIGSPYCESILPGARGASSFDFFVHGGKLYLILAHYNKKKATIWDCDSITCVETLKGHTSYVRSTSSHSELPILFTGSEDGTIRLWNSGTFRLEGILDCGLGSVREIACLKGSRRIATIHRHGLAIIEIDHEQEGPSTSETI